MQQSLSSLRTNSVRSQSYCDENFVLCTSNHRRTTSDPLFLTKILSDEIMRENNKTLGPFLEELSRLAQRVERMQSIAEDLNRLAQRVERMQSIAEDLNRLAQRVEIMKN